MGNASAKEDVENGGSGGGDDPAVRSGGDPGFLRGGGARRSRSLEAMGSSPPESPSRSRSPLMFAPQVPVAPLQRASDAPSGFNHYWMNDPYVTSDPPLEKGIPVLITWNFGGTNVLVEGSWDNWTSRKALQRSGKDHSILLVLPSGVYQYRFFVDGQWRYIVDLPSVANEMGHFNIIDVNEYVPEDLQSVGEFESPPSPDSSYGHMLPVDEDFAKEPPTVPPQLHLTVLGTQQPDDQAIVNPQHVVLNHLFIEKGWSSQSLVPLGFTHRFQSKYVTVVLYKPARR
ncbi:SNF1-related protein kinase regulatory subunit beta-1 [Apostasia shenzhenica]|uniref:SNF1-related protein kinase regulatory subunit beta-1 n=1 Tax=Apostasia shenzhenica TaxID=1088818 RepID=A0A2H9ZXZ2_9ASPA|nr:SNF1-related protein kinase regulatory subunit beta-1 [Apostasia shenzhenica]